MKMNVKSPGSRIAPSSFARVLLVMFSLCVLPRELFAEEKLTLKVGATLALTGKYAFIGEAERDGLRLAVEEVNARPEMKDQQIELFIEDNGGEAKNAVSGVQKLLESDRVDVVFSAFTHITRAIQPIVSARKKLLIYASSVREMAEKNEFVFRDYLDIQSDAQLTMRTLAADGRKRIAYLRDDGEVCAMHEQELNVAGASGGPKIVYRDEFPAGSTDLRTVLLKLYQSAQLDAVLFCAWRDMEVIVRQGEALGLLKKYPIYLTLAPFLPAADSVTMRKVYEQLGAKSTWCGFLEGSLGAAQKDFINKFRARFGHLPRPESAYAYDDIIVLARARERCDLGASQHVSAECLSRELLSVNYDGAAGHLSFSAKRVSTRSAFMMQVKDGEWQKVE